MKYSILIIEDDQILAEKISALLEKYHYTCLTAKDFDSLEELVGQIKPDLILLDINLPRYDGFYWCRKIRASNKVPILMISARNETYDQIRGMESGADDYLIKPFDLDVLLAKVNAIIRRNYGELKLADGEEEERTEKKGIMYYPGRQTAVFQKNSAELSYVEANLFYMLFQAYPDAVSRNELFMEVWDGTSYVEENTLNVNIRRLREKLKAQKIPVEIHAIRSYGYKLVIGGETE